MSDDSDAVLPESLSLDEAFRSAFYLALAYLRRADRPSHDLDLLVEYLWADPARWQDWQSAVRRALGDGGLADPDHDGRWRPHSDWPA